MLIASSPVEIDAEAETAGLSPAAHAAARELFHSLTDRLGRAVAELSVGHEDWPTHRFYFAAEPGGLAPLRAGLQARADIAEIGDAGPAEVRSGLAGLYCADGRDGCEAILVGHENHEGYLSPSKAT